MSFISYAQNLEDVVLWKALKNVHDGFYVDVGANDPIIDSVTKSFYINGWRGINIEPLLQHYKDLIADRPEDINLNCALNEFSGKLDIWECDVRGWATLDREVAKAHEQEGYQGQWHNVEVRTLSDIFDEYNPTDIHFLKVDVEGLELSVLKGNDWNKYRPWIVMVESTFPNTQIETHTEIEEYLLNHSYIFAYADGLNRYYVSIEHKSLLDSLKYPPNVFDDYKTFSEYSVTEELHALTLQYNNLKQKVIADIEKIDNVSIVELLKQGNLQLDSLINNYGENKNTIETLNNNLQQINDFIHYTAKNQSMQYDSLAQDITRLSIENERVNIGYQELNTVYEAEKENVKNLEHQVFLLNKYINELKSSTSWKVSAPIRMLGIIKLNGLRFALKATLKKIIRICSRYPRLRRGIVLFAKKTGTYSLLRKLYIKGLVSNGPSMSFSANEVLVKQNITFSLLNSSEKISIDELHNRIKNELQVASEERGKK